MGEHTEPDPNERQDQPADPYSQAPQQLSAAQPDQPGQPPWYGTELYSGGTTWGSAPAAAWPGAGGPSDPGAPSTTAPKSKPWKKVAGGLALAAVIAGGGVAAVSAANAASTSTSTQTASSGFGANGNGMAANGYGVGPGGSGTGMPGGRGGVSALSNALHGEFVVQTQDGGTRTQRLQSGEVTALSADSLLVTSSDGFTATYVLPADLDVSTIAVGDTVRVIATVDGATVTATSVQSGTGSGQVPTGAPGDAPAAPQTS